MENVGLHDPEELAFTVVFPLPYRVLVLTGLGILGWATNLHGLSLYGIDATTALGLRHNPQNIYASLPAQRSIGFRQFSDLSMTYDTLYRLFSAYFLCCLTSWLCFRYATGGQIALLDAYSYIPGMTALAFIAALVCPYNILFKSDRDKFLHALKRCCFSPMDSPVYFADVVLADVFTSFAKVLGDAWIALCMVLPGNSLLFTPNQSDWHRWILPTVMSVPYIVRFKQCLSEYSSPSNNSKRPLYNALKYATAFPVLYLSTMQPLVVAQLMREKGEKVVQQPWHGEHQLFRLWLLATFINSVYSFWWDVTNDWGMGLLRVEPTEEVRNQPPRQLVLPQLHTSGSLLSSASSSTSSLQLSGDADADLGKPKIPIRGLRPTLYYPTWTYPLLIGVNFALRLIWLVKLSSHVHLQSDGTIATFTFEVAEVVRRWLWVFFRVEWEAIRKARERGSWSRVEEVGDAEFEMASSPSS
ncbi:EXS-domain-containing protein [Pluteus cervinus]|uniref:EXS-domain-containing protein n=1 Tax=Pluteus cervinus TaxID=181527 RepID=A0ACD3B740_9AGAR|nr:EXS-domain-containing protein [Pluteus cervinus]